MIDLLKKMFNRALTPVIALDSHGKTVWVNNAFQDCFGYTMSDLKGQRPSPLFASVHENKLKSLISRAFTGNPTKAFDIPIICLDKTVKDTRWTAMIIHNDGDLIQKTVVLCCTELDGHDNLKPDVENAEDRYRLIFENHGINMIFITDDTTIVLVSKEFEKMTGYSKEQVEGKMKWTEFITCEEDLIKMKTYKNLRKIDPTLAPEIYNTKIRTRLGKRNILLYITTIPATSYTLISLIDLKGKPLKKKTVNGDEKKFRIFVENMHDIFYMCDMTGDITFLSPSGAKLLGYDSPQDLMKKNIKDLEYNPGQLKMFLNSLKIQDRVSNYEMILRHKDGSPISVSSNSQIIYNNKGDPAGIEGILSDITKRKRAEDKFTNVFMMSPEAIAITQLRDGSIIDINMGFEEITGWEQKDVLGRTTLEIDLYNDISIRPLLMQELETGKHIQNHEFQFRRNDGTVREGIFSARSISIGGEQCIIFVMRDITDLKHLEEDRMRLQRQANHSQKMDAIGQLASGLAHDFNNILMGIQANVSLLQMILNPEDPHFQRLRRIEEHIKRGSSMTRQLLGFSRETAPDIKILSINEVIRKSAEFFIETRKDVKADLQLNTDIYPAEVDAGQIEQVLFNIYINAGQAMHDGGCLCIHTMNVTLEEGGAGVLDIPQGDYIKISISDTGTGMDEATLKRIFEPYFTTKSQGSGLGLASAYGIIRNHRGAIDAYSQPGHGATFNIYLPSSVQKIIKDGTATEERVKLGSGGILVIDDESMILDTLSDILKMLGYTVYKASNAQQAISTYIENQGKIDLVILDMILPTMGGAYILKKIRDINHRVKIVISSGYDLQKSERDLLGIDECQGFIQKPYNLEELARIIHYALYPSNQAEIDAKADGDKMSD